jgi:hypothetical protein
LLLYLVAQLSGRILDAGLAEVCISSHGMILTLGYAAIVVPAARLEPPFQGHLLALAEELATCLGEPIPGDDVVVIGNGLS